MNKGLLSLFGYLFFATGMIALILSLIGLKISFLAWADSDPLLGLMVKLGLIMTGLILMYVVKIRSEEE